jgi:hypothetical protein
METFEAGRAVRLRGDAAKTGVVVVPDWDNYTVLWDGTNAIETRVEGKTLISRQWEYHIEGAAALHKALTASFANPNAPTDEAMDLIREYEEHCRREGAAEAAADYQE